MFFTCFEEQNRWSMRFAASFAYSSPLWSMAWCLGAHTATHRAHLRQGPSWQARWRWFRSKRVETIAGVVILASFFEEITKRPCLEHVQVASINWEMNIWLVLTSFFKHQTTHLEAPSPPCCAASWEWWSPPTPMLGPPWLVPTRATRRASTPPSVVAAWWAMPCAPLASSSCGSCWASTARPGGVGEMVDIGLIWMVVHGSSWRKHVPREYPFSENIENRKNWKVTKCLSFGIRWIFQTGHV